jgi:hypothetical protein
LLQFDRFELQRRCESRLGRRRMRGSRARDRSERPHWLAAFQGHEGGRELELRLEPDSPGFGRRAHEFGSQVTFGRERSERRPTQKRHDPRLPSEAIHLRTRLFQRQLERRFLAEREHRDGNLARCVLVGHRRGSRITPPRAARFGVGPTSFRTRRESGAP